jgi:hypothetical protein
LLTAPFSASTPHGTWESAMNAATSVTSAAKEGNFARSREITVPRGRTAAPARPEAGS